MIKKIDERRETKVFSRHYEKHSDMAIQDSFKMTELGLIPNDWAIYSIKETGKIIGGGTPSTFNSDYWNGDISWFTPAELSKAGKFVSNSERTISTLGLNNSSAKMLPKGTILLTTRASIGISAILEKPACTNQGFQSIVANKNFSNEFLYYLLSTKVSEMVSLASGSTFLEISPKKLGGILLALPPKIEEQKRIAQALSDVDAVITTTEKLLAKKKALKQGTMQTLLSGKKRIQNGKWIKTTHFKQTELGPIPQEWEVKNINKTCTIKARIGWQGLKSNEYLESGDYLLVTGTDFENGFINWKTCSYVSEWRFKQDKNIQIKKGDVLITKDGTIGKVAFLNEIPQEGTLNSGVFVVRPKNSDEINSIFLSLVFKSFWFDDFLEQITSGSTIVHLYQKDFTKFNFPLPSKPEQTAIAIVLSDMDSEIATLETKLAKYRQLKTGMMQQLLTGKIRLV